MACTIDGEDAAKLMLVVGTDAGGLEHPNWRENLSLAAVLQARLQQDYQGLMRPINLRTERFNQDLAPMDLLVEVGASGEQPGGGHTIRRGLCVGAGGCVGSVQR